MRVATRVAEPRRAIRYPSARSCSYASTTTPRESERSAASARDEGSGDALAQATRLDGGAQLALDLRAQGCRRIAANGQQELGN